MDISRMSIVDIAIIAGNVSISVGVIIAIWQLFLGKRSFNADHERRKKQATIEHYSRICNEFREALKRINAKFPDDKVVKIHNPVDDKDMLDDVATYLSHMEKFAIGINTNIYDFDVFKRMSGVWAVRYYDRFKEAIEYLRMRPYSQKAYMNYEDLISKLRDSQKDEVPKPTVLKTF